MNKLLLGSLVAIAVIFFSGCTYKAAPTVKIAETICVGCEGLPDCVPGPYGDCLQIK